jgi:hypothetical protein
MSVRRLGLRKPDPVKLASHPDAAEHPILRVRFAAHADGSLLLPESADKLPKPPTSADGLDIDQGLSGSCTLGSTSCALWVALVSKGLSLPFVPSQRFGYATVRATERAAGIAQGDGLPALADAGADLEDVLTMCGTIGLVPMKVGKTPDGRFYDLWTDDDTGIGTGNVNDEPESLDIEDAASAIVTVDPAAHVLSPSDPAVSDKMAAALDASPAIPIIAGGLVDSAFMRLQSGQVAQAPDPRDPYAGGHAYFFSKYRSASNGQREFFLKNSWGHWCEGNGCWASMAFIIQQWAMWILDPTILSRKMGRAA